MTSEVWTVPAPCWDGVGVYNGYHVVAALHTRGSPAVSMKVLPLLIVAIALCAVVDAGRKIDLFINQSIS